MTFIDYLCYNRSSIGGPIMPIKVAQLTDEDVKHVRSRMRKKFAYLNPKDSTVANIRSWLKHHYPHVRFSVQGGKTEKSALSVGWVNYGDNLTPHDREIRASLKHFVCWNRSSIELSKYGQHQACEVENKFFTDMFGGVHILECVLKSPTEAQRQRRETLTAQKDHKTLSEALDMESGTSIGATRKRM